MLKRQAIGPEGDVTIVFDDAVLSVAHQWPATAGELRPDLVGPAGVQTDTDAGQVLFPV